MRKIFISYRRSEAAFPAGALGRDLRRRFGEERVFRDREDIGGGARWREKILSEIDHDAVLLVLIGSHWLTSEVGKQHPRLHDPNDSVRMEIADGIRDGATIIPVLLEDTPMPSPERLPEDLRFLCDVNALHLRDADWQHDIERICTTLERIGFVANQRRTLSPGEARVARHEGTSWKTVAAIVLGLLCTLVLADDYDSDSKSSLLIFGSMALALAVWAWFDREHRGKRNAWLNAAATLLSLSLLLMALVREAKPAETSTSAATDGGSKAE